MDELLNFRGNGYSVKILDNGETKTLKYNGITYSLLNKKGKYTDSYYDCFLPLPLLYDQANVLVIGLGGGTIPYNLKMIYGEKVKIDVVESNKNMVEIARKFLNVDHFDFDIIVDDGFEYLQKCTKFYDIIILDAFINDNIPRQFLSDEFIRLANDKLTAKGILTINYIPKLFFQHIYARRIKNYFKLYKINHKDNVIFIGSKYFDNKYIANIAREKLTSNDDSKIIRFYLTL
jgi:spermidine synthase